MSDKELTRNNGLLDLLESGDSVKADHDFDIKGVDLDMRIIKNKKVCELNYK